MGELDDLLLEAAGRTGRSSRKNNPPSKSKWQQNSSYSDTSDDDSDDEKHAKKKKPSGSQIPLKKRFDPPGSRSGWDSGGDDEDRENDEDSDSGSYGSDLYKNDKDKEELSKLDELQREMILTERSMKKDDERLKKMAKQAGSSKQDKKPSRRDSPPPLTSRSRASARSERASAAKTDALNELRAKRLKQQDPEGYHRFKDVLGLGLRSERDSSPKRKAGTASGSESDESESQSDGDTKIHDNVDDEGCPSSLKLRFEDVKEITIRRRKLAKWFMEPFFEELVVGCFVRVGIGMTRSGRPRYRLCIVRNVDVSDPNRRYKFEGYMTHKFLNCVWGSESSAARWQMAMISDTEPTEEEFNDWVQEVERTNGRMPTRQEVDDKKESIQKINTFVYSSATVKQMLQEKKSASARPINVAAEKDRLRKEMEWAESRRDEAEMERIRERLKELEQKSRPTKMNEKAVKLAEMNRKNRAENFRNASELKPVNTSLKAGEAGYDPFSRRWTRSRNYYVSKPGEGESENRDSSDLVVGDETSNGVVTANGEAVTAAALEAAAGAGKLVDTKAPVDQGTESNSLHNFELPISLAHLQKFGGPQGAYLAFLARKQKIEATVGYKVPENDGRRHALTLTHSVTIRNGGRYGLLAVLSVRIPNPAAACFLLF